LRHNGQIRLPGLDTVQIVIPRTGGVRTGNRLTAERWASMLRERIVSVSVNEGDAVAPVDLLIVRHGLKSRPALLDFRARRPGGRVILVLTGTDIYGDHDDEGDQAALHDAMEAADRLVVLQDQALERIPARFHDRTRVILQSVAPTAGSGAPRGVDPFVICVVGHFRDVKDPLRAAGTGECRMLRGPGYPPRPRLRSPGRTALRSTPSISLPKSGWSIRFMIAWMSG
jgi:hypothetical protein